MVLLPEVGCLIFDKPHRGPTVPRFPLYCYYLGIGNLKEVGLAHGSDGQWHPGEGTLATSQCNGKIGRELDGC